MPLVYADEDVAAAVLGAGAWHAPYAAAMQPGVRRRVRRGWRGQPVPPGWQRKWRRPWPGVQSRPRGVGDWMYTAPSPQVGALYQAGMGANILETIGLRSPLTKYEQKGLTLPQIYQRFASAVARYTAVVRQIPSGSAQRALANELGGLGRRQAELAPAFVPGARPGARDRQRLADFVAAVKAFRTKLAAAVKGYGLRVLVPDPEREIVTGAPPAAGFPVVPVLIALAVAVTL